MKLALTTVFLTTLSAACLAQPNIPTFDLQIKIDSLTQTNFQVKGSVTTQRPPLQLFLMPHHQFSFRSENGPLRLKNGDSIASKVLYFEGRSNIASSAKCSGNGEEVYCLNRVLPNPEFASDASRYKVQFELPAGYSALTSSPEVLQDSGLAFQVARLKPPTRFQTLSMTLEESWPEDFRPDPRYLEWLHSQAKLWQELLGPLEFSTIKVGAIHRGKDREISGSPSGNLILYSRSALGGAFNSPSLDSLGLKSDLSDALRKLVISHELTHFWFGQKYRGNEGWMVEGIPQYLSLWSVLQDSSVDRDDLLKFFRVSGNSASGPIPGQPLDDSAGYLKAYYQAPLALLSIGDAVGHEQLRLLLLKVFQKNSDPKFQDFDVEFKAAYPKQYAAWRTAWRLPSN
jgi:hypothetical protein